VVASDRLPAPRRGEWRSLVREREQSFEEYVRVCSNRKSPTRSRLVIVPLGDLEGRAAPTLGLLRDYGASFFGLDSSLAGAIPLLDAAHVPQRGQYNSSMILDDLADRTETDALVTLGVTDADLFSRGKRYVFGEGNLERRVGVCSFARLGPADGPLFRRRALRLMSHEAAHVLSLPHCVRRRCLMQGANTIEECDGHPLQPCDEDFRKLCWNTGLDPAKRAADLAAFYQALGWTAEGGFPGTDLG
jgi:predicted Zn-dependent protease